MTNPVTILVVEDDEIAIKKIRRTFAEIRLANPILQASDGLEALEMLRARKVDRPYIILLDLNMPRMNGIEFLKELRGDPDLTKDIVFVLTTSEDEEDKLSAYNFHVAGYMVKSKIKDGFMDAVNMLQAYWKVVELP